jgi:hypothetical protein
MIEAKSLDGKNNYRDTKKMLLLKWSDLIY